MATPTCQPLLPGLLGYKRYCPYTLHPTPNGAWTAPDLVLAKKLVDESGTKGDVVTVLGSPDEGMIPSQEAAYITQVLGSLGYRARLKMVPFNLFGPGEMQEMQLQQVQLSVEGDCEPGVPGSLVISYLRFSLATAVIRAMSAVAATLTIATPLSTGRCNRRRSSKIKARSRQRVCGPGSTAS